MINGAGYSHKYEIIMEGVWKDLGLSDKTIDDDTRRVRGEELRKFKTELIRGSHDNFEQWYEAYRK